MVSPERFRRYCGVFEVTGQSAGAHVVLWLRRRISEQAVIEDAALRGVGVYPISPYFLLPPSRTAILLGYARMREADIRDGIRRLSAVLQPSPYVRQRSSGSNEACG